MFPFLSYPKMALKKCNVGTSDTSGPVSSRTRKIKSDRTTDEELGSGVDEFSDASVYGETVDAPSDNDATVEGGEVEIGDVRGVVVDDVTPWWTVVRHVFLAYTRGFCALSC